MVWISGSSRRQPQGLLAQLPRPGEVLLACEPVGDLGQLQGLAGGGRDLGVYLASKGSGEAADAALEPSGRWAIGS